MWFSKIKQKEVKKKRKKKTWELTQSFKCITCWHGKELYKLCNNLKQVAMIWTGNQKSRRLKLQ